MLMLFMSLRVFGLGELLVELLELDIREIKEKVVIVL